MENKEMTKEGKKNNTIRKAILIGLTIVFFACILGYVKQEKDRQKKNKLLRNTESRKNICVEYVDEHVTGKYGPSYFESENRGFFKNGYISYKGQKYKRNTAVKAYLFMGVDREGSLQKPVTVPFTGGQTDILWLIAFDTANEKARVVQFQRDSMTPVNITDKNGRIRYKELTEITVAYGYGDGSTVSADYTKESLSYLLDGLTFDGFLAIPFNSAATLTEHVGGVPVKIGHLETDMGYKEGETVTLKGEEAVQFVRIRDMFADGGAEMRMNKHERFFKSFEKQTKKSLKTNPNVIHEMFTDIEDDMLTDIPKGDYVKLANTFAKGKSVSDSIITPEGTLDSSQIYEAFYPDMDKLHNLIVELFYRPVE